MLEISNYLQTMAVIIDMMYLPHPSRKLSIARDRPLRAGLGRPGPPPDLISMYVYILICDLYGTETENLYTNDNTDIDA